MDLPSFSLYQSVCRSGLSAIRPLTEYAKARDPSGWNFGSGWPPSHAAFGRMRTLCTLQRIRALRPRRVLELAAGDASLSACLAADGTSVFANDLRAENLKEAMASFINAGDIMLLPGNLFDLRPSRIGTFDVIAACEIIEHVAHPDDFLSHIKQFLAPDGCILLTTPNGSYFRNRLPTIVQIDDFNTLEGSQFKPDADGHLFLITPRELRELAKRVGLSVRVLDLLGTPFITGHCRLSSASGQEIASLCYNLEKAFQRLPVKLQEKFCFSILALLD